MGSEFKTHEKKHAKMCGNCRYRGKVTGHCPKEATASNGTNPYVERTDPACDHFEN